MERIKGILGFGGMRLPMKDGEVVIDEMNRMVDAFLEAGFNYFDTARVYIGGQGETAIRDCVVKRYPRDSFILTDKLSDSLFNSEDEIRPLFEKQLESCGVDYFDFYLLHSQTKSIFEKYKKLHAYEHAFELKKEGKVKHVGFSFHDTADVLDEMLNEYPEIEVVQIQLNYIDFDDPAVQARLCYEVCRKHNKPVIVMEPVRGGKLADIPEQGKAIFDALHGGSPASYAIRYAADFDGVFMVLSGMSSMEQVEDNTAYMQDMKPLTEKEQAITLHAKEAYRRVWKYNCADFDKLDDNAAGVPISGIIRAYNSLLIQPNPYFGAELNYYKTFRSAYDRTFETADYSAQTEVIGGAFDVNKALRESIEFQAKNGF